jgi:phospholipase/lecithinase/hemolysin
MSRFFAFWGMILLPLLMVPATQAAFSSIYVFGDGVSATTNYPNSANYYGYRYSNGRSWVEVLAQRQGLGATSLSSTNWNYSTNNRSFYGHYSSLLVTNANNFVAPANATNCLFVLWVANADFVGDISANPPPATTNLTTWTNAINQHLTNHFRAITNLYAKGMRTLVAPNAVDLTKVPQYSGITISAPGYRNFVRQRTIEFNNAYSNRLNQIAANSPGLNIVLVDVFSLLDDLVANAAKYGLTNVLDSDDGSITSAQQHLTTPQAAQLNGPGTNYIWWGQIAPSARFHEVIADTAQEMLSPVMIESVSPINGSNQLQLANAPIGMNGLVLYSTDLASSVWLTNSTFSTLTTTQTVFVNPTNSLRFYRLKFPWQWTWP